MSLLPKVLRGTTHTTHFRDPSPEELRAIRLPANQQQVIVMKADRASGGQSGSFLGGVLRAIPEPARVPVGLGLAAAIAFAVSDRDEVRIAQYASGAVAAGGALTGLALLSVGHGAGVPLTLGERVAPAASLLKWSLPIASAAVGTEWLRSQDDQSAEGKRGKRRRAQRD